MTRTSRPVLLVDGNSVGWRAFHGAPDLTSPHTGEPTGMAYVFLNMLRSAVNLYGPVATMVVWDRGRSAFRTKLYPEYKHRRPSTNPTPERREEYETFDAQQRWLGAILPRLGVVQCSVNGWEADDVVALFALRPGAPRIIFSGDRDFWQLISPRVSVLYPTKEALLTRQNFQEQTRLASPTQWLVYRILSGDHGDNIPGIGGIGTKRGLAVAKAYATEPFSLHRLEAQLSEWKTAEWVAARRSALNRNIILMSLTLSASLLMRDVRRGAAVPEFVRGQKDIDGAINVIEEAGMTSILSQFIRWMAPFGALQ